MAGSSVVWAGRLAALPVLPTPIGNRSRCHCAVGVPTSTRACLFCAGHSRAVQVNAHGSFQGLLLGNPEKQQLRAPRRTPLPALSSTDGTLQVQYLSPRYVPKPASPVARLSKNNTSATQCHGMFFFSGRPKVHVFSGHSRPRFVRPRRRSGGHQVPDTPAGRCVGPPCLSRNAIAAPFPRAAR